jgi:hypothetical protein
MNAFDNAILRALARNRRRAIVHRRSSGISADPVVTIGIATIKIVTEEQIQAIAFGEIGAEPEVIVRLDPIGRDITDLRPFAAFLGRVIGDGSAAGSPTADCWLVLH